MRHANTSAPLRIWTVRQSLTIQRLFMYSKMLRQVVSFMMADNFSTMFTSGSSVLWYFIMIVDCHPHQSGCRFPQKASPCSLNLQMKLECIRSSWTILPSIHLTQSSRRKQKRTIVGKLLIDPVEGWPSQKKVFSNYTSCFIKISKPL